MLRKYKDLYDFDEITQFRLINTFLFAVGFNLILPVLMDLRGELLTTQFITFILIMTTLSVKVNKYLVKFSLSDLYKVGNISHVLFFSAGFLYFWDKLYFVYADSFFAILEIAIFSSYRIKLDTYLADNYANTVKDFHVFRNSIFADATLIGLFLVWITSYFSGNSLSVSVFIAYNMMFLTWLIYHWNYINNVLEKNKVNKV